MKSILLAASSLALLAISPIASANQASDTTITIVEQAAGATPFISNLKLQASDLTNLRKIRFTIQPKAGSVTRPISATYALQHLRGRGFVNSATGEINYPVFGLYDNYDNTVALRYIFADGSVKETTTHVATQPFDDACDSNTPTVQQERTATRQLSYDYILLASSCGKHSPTIVDTDGAVRWVGTADLQQHFIAFYHNGIYITDGPRLLRMELDGAVQVLTDYSDRGVVSFNHNIDYGRNGIIVDVNTTAYIASVHMEVDQAGNVLRTWNLGDIISKAMTDGGDDPSGFVRTVKDRYDFGAFEDWTHDNAVTYRKSDNTVIISSRENYVIALDYDTSAIKWILGNHSKKWYQYPSLRKYALDLATGSIAPVGQHAVSITKDDSLLLFDNGEASAHHSPAGPTRNYSAPRKYSLDLTNNVATETWNFTNGFAVRSSFESSVYEDAANNYLVAYAIARNPDGTLRAEILGLTAAGEKVFDYSYPTQHCCDEVYRAIPVHWEKLKFLQRVTVQPRGATSG